MTKQQNNKNYKQLSAPLVAIITLLVILLSQIQLVQAQQTFPGYDFYPLSPLRNLIPANAVYTRDDRIGSFRNSYEAWECPTYRVSANETHPLVTITNTSSGRVEKWPIPTYAIPASGDDMHLCVINLSNKMVYEFWEAVWVTPTTMRAGGMVSFPMNSTGVSNPVYYRVTASGFSNTIGMVKREDFIDPTTGQVQVTDTTVLRHALTMAVHWSLLGKNTYVAPAVGGEILGYATTNGIPMGARFALPRNLDVDALNVDPFVRTILRAARDYGIYISDGSGTAKYNGKDAGILEIETGLMPLLYGSGTSNDTFLNTIQSQVYTVIQQYGLYRVTGGTGPAPATTTPRPNNTATLTPTFTPTVRPTNTPVAPTSTIRPTNTAVAPTFTPTVRPTNTSVAPTSTIRPTNTPVAPTSTIRPTNTPVAPTSTIRPTNTPVAPTFTPTVRPTNTPVAPTFTPTVRPTNTSVAPTSTIRPTNTVTPRPATVTPRPTNTPTPRPATATPRPTSTIPPKTLPTSIPIPTGLGANIVVPTNIRVNTVFNVNINLNNPNLASGGGVDAAQVECTLTPESRLIGQNVASGTLFGPNPVIINRNFPYTDWMLFAVSQSGTNPPIITSGTIVSLSIRPSSRGRGTISCTVDIIGADGVSRSLTVSSVTFQVQR